MLFELHQFLPSSNGFALSFARLVFPSIFCGVLHVYFKVWVRGGSVQCEVRVFSLRCQFLEVVINDIQPGSKSSYREDWILGKNHNKIYYIFRPRLDLFLRSLFTVLYSRPKLHQCILKAEVVTLASIMFLENLKKITSRTAKSCGGLSSPNTNRSVQASDSNMF